MIAAMIAAATTMRTVEGDGRHDGRLGLSVGRTGPGRRGRLRLRRNIDHLVRSRSIVGAAAHAAVGART
jgi:hypothetical protein